MKILTIILCLLAGTIISFGQNIVQVEYFVDADLGVGKNNLLSVPASPDGSFPFRVTLTNVSAGIHQLYIRTKDSNGGWSSTSRRNIEVLPTVAGAVSAGEYFIDEDPGFGAGKTITVSPKDSAVMQNFSPATTGLSVGNHKLYMRFKDARGKWGLTARRNMEILNPPVTLIKGGEYFFLSDPGVGSATPFTVEKPAADSSFSFKIPLANIPSGGTAFYLRVKDSVNNNWSLTQWQTDSVVTSVQSGLWSDVNTWSNHKIPVSSTIVILHNNVTVDIIAFCRSLTPYRNDVHLTVNQGITLNITGH